MVTPGEIYSKLSDRRFELLDERVRTLSDESFYVEKGFAEALKIVYDMIMGNADEERLKEGDEDA